MTNLNLQLTQIAIDNNIVKPYVLYLTVKGWYRHSIIYNYNPNKIARKTGLHHKTVKKYVNLLLNNGFCELRNNHLLFKNPYRIITGDKHKRKGKIVKVDSTNIYNEIILSVLRTNKNQQNYKIAVKIAMKSIDKAMSFVKQNNEIKLTRKKLIKIVSKTNPRKSKSLSSFKVVFTNKSLSKLLRVSPSSISNIIPKLELPKYKEFQFISKIDSKFNLRHYCKYNKGYYYIRGNSLFRLLGFSLSGL